MDDIRGEKANFDDDKSLSPQVKALLDKAGLSEAEWQTLPIFLIPPALNWATSVIIAEAHGCMGHFPSVPRLRLVN
jgi:hypothetical protein